MCLEKCSLVQVRSLQRLHLSSGISDLHGEEQRLHVPRKLGAERAHVLVSTGAELWESPHPAASTTPLGVGGCTALLASLPPLRAAAGMRLCHVLKRGPSTKVI